MAAPPKKTNRGYRAPRKPRLEESEPDKAAEVAIAFAENANLAVAEIAHKLELPRAAVAALVDRLKRRYSPVVAEIRKHTTKDFQSIIDEKLMMALEYLGDLKLAEASARDLSFVIATLTDKRAMMRGEPTQIVRVEERQALAELLPALLAEAQRRGMTVDLPASEFKEVEAPK